MPLPIHTLSPDQLAAITAPSSGLPEPQQAAINLLAWTGVRAAEAVAITWRQIATPAGARPSLDLTAAQTKTRQPRSIPVNSLLAASVARHLAYCTAAAGDAFDWAWPFLPGTHARPWTTRWLQFALARAGARILRRPINPHLLRHTFATELLRHTNIRIVQLVLGHASIRSTQVYTHPNDRDLAAALERLAQP